MKNNNLENNKRGNSHARCGRVENTEIISKSYLSVLSQIMTSKSVARSCEDVDETVLSYAEVKALATGIPFIKEKIDVDNEVVRLTLLKTTYNNHKYKMEDNFKSKYPNLIAEAKQRTDNIVKDIEISDQNKKEEFEIIISNKAYDNREDAGTIIKVLLDNATSTEEKQIGKFNGFDLFIKKKHLEVITADETEFGNGAKDSRDNKNIDESNKRKSMSEVTNSVGKYEAENIKVEQEINNSIER